MSDVSGGSERVVVRIELTRGEYESLKAIARREGYNLVSEYLRALVKDILEGRVGREARGEGVPVDVIVKRIERVVVDLLNPYTGKIDEISRRLAEIIELLERGEEERRPAVTVRETRRVTAVERLKDQGVVFQEDVQWMKSPDKFFEKLKKEGAVVLTIGSEKVAVDPDFWARFEEEISKISVSNVDEVSSLLEASMGEASAKLFRKMVKAGVIVYDEDEGSWVIRLQKQT